MPAYEVTTICILSKEIKHHVHAENENAAIQKITAKEPTAYTKAAVMAELSMSGELEIRAVDIEKVKGK